MRRIIGLLSIISATTALAAEQVNVYSNRQDELIKPILAEFEAKSGIKVNVIFAKEGLNERLQREGRLTPADVMLTVDVSRLTDLVDKQLLQPVNSDILRQAVPAHLRDKNDNWFALTTRARAIYSTKDRPVDVANITYESLADPKFKGKICMRSGKHEYNVALVSAFIAHHGEADTKTWLQGVKQNLARKPQGNDRDQVKAIKDGLCDVSLGNSYYLGVMLKDPIQQHWAAAVNINFPNQATTGTHINISGIGMTRYAKNPAAAQQLMEFLVSDQAQHMYATVNMEYPVKTGIAPSTLVASWGAFKSDALPVESYGRLRQQALTLLDEVKFDL